MTASVLPAAFAALDPAWWVYLLSWGLPLAGVALGSLVARRWGWRNLVLSGLVVGVIGSVLLAVPAAADLSPAEAVSIAIWVVAVPWLLGGCGTLLIRRRRARRHVASQR